MSKTNDNLTFKGSKLKIDGPAVKEGAAAPEFKLTGQDLSDLDGAQFKGAPLVILSVPSLDTPVCAVEVKKFSQQAAEYIAGTKLLIVSRDLPFAQKRYCAAENVNNIVLGSDYKYRTFGTGYGVDASDMGLLARAVFVIGKDSKVLYVEYVNDISHEPDYNAALAAVQSAG